MRRMQACLALCLPALLSAATPALAGTDDDTAAANIPPVLGQPPFSDNPTNASPEVGLRIFPPTDTSLITNQRYDLRVETQVPTTSATAPTLKSLTVNGVEIRDLFNSTITAQGLGPESGTPTVPGLFGATARNLSFSQPGNYRVEAVVSVAGRDYRIRNTWVVAPFALKNNIRHLVFFLGDAMGLPVRSAARIAAKGIFEGRAKGKLNMDRMDTYGLAYTASFDSVITDSAPGMATYVTGMKQANNALNVSVDNTPESTLDNPRIETLWEYLKRTQGWSIGIVTDAYATDATPAAVAAHTRARSNRTAIAQQYLDYYVDNTSQPATGFAALKELTQPVDVLLGSGARDFLPTGNTTLQNFYQYSSSQGRTDGVNLFDVATNLGYAVVKDKNELLAAPNSKPLLGIFVGDFRPTADVTSGSQVPNALGADNIPGTLDRLVARNQATIGGKTASDAVLGLVSAPPVGTGCGATVQQCFINIPSKVEMVNKAIKVLNARTPDGWVLLVEQSQSDKLAHPLEYERVIYEALELDDALGYVMRSTDRRTLTLVTADHAQPETIVGITIPSALDGKPGFAGTPDAADPLVPGGCFTSDGTTLSLSYSSSTGRPCDLQDAIGTFNDGTFPTYSDANRDGYPDDPDPTVKLIIEDGGRPTYSQNYLTNPIPLSPSGTNAAFPNPNRDPNGLLLTGNMPTRNVAPISKDNGNTSVAPHTAEDVPVSVSGPGADLFGGTYENADVFVRLSAALSATASQLSGSAARALVRDVLPVDFPRFHPQTLLNQRGRSK